MNVEEAGAVGGGRDDRESRHECVARSLCEKEGTPKEVVWFRVMKRREPLR